MKTRSIEILVHPDGELKIDALGFSGADCEQATAFLEEALGRTHTKRRKPEFFHRTQRQQVQRTGL